MLQRPRGTSRVHTSSSSSLSTIHSNPSFLSSPSRPASPPFISSLPCPVQLCCCLQEKHGQKQAITSNTRRAVHYYCTSGPVRPSTLSPCRKNPAHLYCTVARRSPSFSISGTVTQPQHHYHLDSITSPSHPPSAPSHASLLPKILSIEFAGHRYSFIFITYSYFLCPCPPLDTPLRSSLLGSSALSRRDHPGRLHQIITPSNSNFPSAISLLLRLQTAKTQ